MESFQLRFPKLVRLQKSFGTTKTATVSKQDFESTVLEASQT